jgi:hypothetical protein
MMVTENGSMHFADYLSVYRGDGEDSWDRHAVVRSKQRVSIDERFDLGRSHLFSPSLTEFADHRHVADLGPEAIARVRWGRLSDYLLRTERVEIEIVNRALALLLTGFDLPRGLKADLLKIYTDEGYHVLMMSEFGCELQGVTGFKLVRRTFQDLNDLVSEVNRFSGDDAWLAATTCAIVTETLISGTLRKAADEKVFGPVRAILSDHARDESYHHASFSRLAKSLIPCLSRRELEVVEYVAPIALHNFLTPDLKNICEDLTSVGLTDSRIEEVTGALVDPIRSHAALLSASVATRRLFEQLGVPICL